ncbi:sterile alpha motif domain-containing protein 10 isoform X1 [Accipiter gentilis]|uniref:sterile alpha motif domain-containing protein 10 isoform X1 n=1 Tax=Astur gentilis TaxID=8957 RepID=UPI002110AF38|nr:sterile alpha motif domain-containing protein 10 isoform X1 [Accipiter gentilis]
MSCGQPKDMEAAAAHFSFCRSLLEHTVSAENLSYRLQRNPGSSLTWHDGRSQRADGGRTVKLLRQPGTEGSQEAVSRRFPAICLLPCLCTATGRSIFPACGSWCFLTPLQHPGSGVQRRHIQLVSAGKKMGKMELPSFQPPTWRCCDAPRSGSPRGAVSPVLVALSPSPLQAPRWLFPSHTSAKTMGTALPAQPCLHSPACTGTRQPLSGYQLRSSWLSLVCLHLPPRGI